MSSGNLDTIRFDSISFPIATLDLHILTATAFDNFCLRLYASILTTNHAGIFRRKCTHHLGCLGATKDSISPLIPWLLTWEHKHSMNNSHGFFRAQYEP